MNLAHVASYVGSTLGKALPLAAIMEGEHGIPRHAIMKEIALNLEGMGLCANLGFDKLPTKEHDGAPAHGSSPVIKDSGRGGPLMA